MCQRTAQTGSGFVYAGFCGRRSCGTHAGGSAGRAPDRVLPPAGSYSGGSVRQCAAAGPKFYGNAHFRRYNGDIQRKSALKIRLLGGTGDLHAGQFVDRVGVALGLRFPAGKEMEQLAARAIRRDIKLPAHVDALQCSFSGVETRAQALIGNAPGEEIAYAVYDCMARTFAKLIRNAADAQCVVDEPRVLIAGGVASSALLRSLLVSRLNGSGIKLLFGHPELSSDNAVGTALIAMDLLNGRSLN